MPIGLYIDIAVGIDRAGGRCLEPAGRRLDERIDRRAAGRIQSGGPGLGAAPFNPHALARNDFALVRQLMRAAMRHADAIRLDHVMGLKRMYLIPREADTVHGAYVRYPFEALLGVVAQESDRARCIVIGEDLGTVPEGFRDTLARWGLWGTA